MIEIRSITVNYFGENTFLVFDEANEAVIIDCGCMTAQEWKKIEDFVAQHGLTVKHHLCTHMHVDHLLGAEYVHRSYGLYPEAAPQDVEALPSISKQAELFRLPLEVNAS